MKKEEKPTKDFSIRNMPQDLHKALKIRAIEEGVTLQDLIIRYLKKGLETDKSGGGK